MRALPRLLPVLAALAAGASALAAQQPGASLEIVVVDATTGEPLAGALVTVGDLRLPTDAEGLVLLSGLSTPAIGGEVTHLGFGPRTFAVPLTPGSTLTLSIPLEPAPIPVEGVAVEVEARYPDVRSRELREFYDRVRTGTGQYFTRADIERRRPRDLSDLIRSVPGMRLLHTPAGEKPIMEAKSTAMGDALDGEGDQCAIQYFLDGTPIKPIHDGVLGAEVRLDEIEGIEIYRRGSTVAAKFHRLNNSCGVVLIWKKERT